MGTDAVRKAACVVRLAVKTPAKAVFNSHESSLWKGSPPHSSM